MRDMRLVVFYVESNNPLKTKINLNYMQRSISYRAVNTFLLGDETQPCCVGKQSLFVLRSIRNLLTD